MKGASKKKLLLGKNFEAELPWDNLEGAPPRLAGSASDELKAGPGSVAKEEDKKASYGHGTAGFGVARMMRGALPSNQAELVTCI